MTSVSYLRFERARPRRALRTEVWLVLSARTNSPLGVILWRGAWRQYVFEPEPDTVWSDGCMVEVQAKIRGLMAARRAA